VPVPTQTLDMRVLQRAAELLGSERALARKLRVPMPALFSWLKGTDKPPRALFLEAVDVLIAHDDSLPPELRLPSGEGAGAPSGSAAPPKAR